MANQSPIEFEDVPLDQARRMGRGPRMEPLLYDTLKKKIQALSNDAVRIRLGPEIAPRRMRNYILRIARELNVPVTVRKVAGGVLFSNMAKTSWLIVSFGDAWCPNVLV
jgi:hypothetical protein